MIGYIYKLTSPNGKIYIGQTIDLDRRHKEYARARSRKTQPKLINCIIKYGWDNFNKELLFEGSCTIDFLNDIEIYYIKKYNSCGTDIGLNLQHGGINGLHTEETKKKMSESAKIAMAGDKGKERNAHWIGRKHSGYTKYKMSKAKKGIKLSKEWSENIRQSLFKRGGKVVMDTQTGIYYSSAREASECYHYAYSTFKGMLNGAKTNKTACMYV